MRPHVAAFHICSGINDNYNTCYDTEEITLGDWNKLKISQKQKDIGIESGIVPLLKVKAQGQVQVSLVLNMFMKSS